MTAGWMVAAARSEAGKEVGACPDGGVVRQAFSGGGWYWAPYRLLPFPRRYLTREEAYRLLRWRVTPAR